MNHEGVLTNGKSLHSLYIGPLPCYLIRCLLGVCLCMCSTIDEKNVGKVGILLLLRFLADSTVYSVIILRGVLLGT